MIATGGVEAFRGRYVFFRRTFLSCLFSILGLCAYGQSGTFTLSGTVTDRETGEALPGASVVIGDNSRGTVADGSGNYSIEIAGGDYKVAWSYLGYTPQTQMLSIAADTVIDIALRRAENRMDDIIVSSRRRDANVSSPEMGVERLTQGRIKSIPALMGEVDVLKALQLLPGVQGTSEGNSGFSVRGGSYDQNLILLDEATLYNPAHLMGFFSVFNPDVINSATLYKGDIPASFGGRLSSLLDVRTKDGGTDRISGSGGIGIISSRLTVNGPLISDKLSFMLSGRRTYADLFPKLSPDKDLRQSKLHFYDTNLKMSWNMNERNRLYLSGYMGRDRFGVKFAGMGFGNRTLTARWNHIFSEKLYSDISFVATGYDYRLDNNMSDGFEQYWKSGLFDLGAKVDFAWHAGENNTLRFGYNGVYHTVRPGKRVNTGENPLFKDISLTGTYAWEHSVYASDETVVNGKLTMKYGLRFTVFNNVSNGKEVVYLNGHEPERAETYPKGKIYNTRTSLEPRLGLVWKFDGRQSLKAGYARTAQYIQMASNSTSGSPLDVWFLSSQNIKPQFSDQYSAGYYRNFKDDMYELSGELYYRDMRNVIDFRDHADLLLNEMLEAEVRFGRGYAYGLELMLRKTAGQLSGWVSYTFSRSFRRVEEINDGRWYRSPFDRPHNVSVVASYDLSDRLSLSMNWTYRSGTPVTYPTGRYEIGHTYVPTYSGRNEYRYPAYHRLDLAAVWQLGKAGKKNGSELVFSLYNAYGRKNPWTIMFDAEDGDPDRMYARQIYFFSYVPSVTWNFVF